MKANIFKILNRATGLYESVIALKGDKPVKGTDYWTTEDKQELVDDVLAALPVAEEVSV